MTKHEEALQLEAEFRDAVDRLKEIGEQPDFDLTRLSRQAVAYTIRLYTDQPLVSDKLAGSKIAELMRKLLRARFDVDLNPYEMNLLFIKLRKDGLLPKKTDRRS